MQVTLVVIQAMSLSLSLVSLSLSSSLSLSLSCILLFLAKSHRLILSPSSQYDLLIERNYLAQFRSLRKNDVNARVKVEQNRDRDSERVW